MKAPLTVIALFFTVFCAPAPGRPPGPATAVPSVTFGPERSTAFRYEEPHAAAKATLLKRINWERRAASVRELKYDLRGAKVGDGFCLLSIQEGTSGHWDLSGRSPYLRWALAGGVDYHAQNFAAQSQSPGPLRGPIERYMLEAHARMMAEVPPADGHKRAVLDPNWTHVGIGAALVDGEFRLTEEFSRQELEWVEIPAGAIKKKEIAHVAAKLPSGWNLLLVEICFEPFPKPMSRRQIAALDSYSYPPPLRRFRPKLGGHQKYGDGLPGEIEIGPGGIFRVPVTPTSGPGNYFVLVYAGHGKVFGKMIGPVTGALVVAK
jgi:uncharacterized protein YkwD